MGIVSCDILQTTRLQTWWVEEGISIMSWKRMVSSYHHLTFWHKGTSGVSAHVPGNMLFLTSGFSPYGSASLNRKGKLLCFIEN
jgi:hypothetical protein